MNEETGAFYIGTYGYDSVFYTKNQIVAIELGSPDLNTFVLLDPDYQGGVMTSSDNERNGSSFDWINYDTLNQVRSLKSYK